MFHLHQKKVNQSAHDITSIVELGADVDAQDEIGITAVRICGGYCGHITVKNALVKVHILLDTGTSLDINTQSKCTVLGFAVLT